MLHQLTYDGSFDGLLTAIFDIYDLKLEQAEIVSGEGNSRNLFSNSIKVVTDKDKAQRVWKGIKKLTDSRTRNSIYKTYLSEIPGIEDHILAYVKLIFKSSGKEARNFSDPVVMRIAKVVKMIDREKHRMDAFVRFRLTKDGVYVATISPDFNVLPLNSNHFEKRYADQAWLIFDIKRRYGIYYDLKQTKMVTIEDDSHLRNGIKEELLDPTELKFTSLWQQYFKSTNIVERKNTALHLRHVPGRYWKYLSEKQL